MGETRRFAIRVPEDELAEWRRKASDHGLNVSEWVRMMCRGGEAPPWAEEVRARIDADPERQPATDALGLIVHDECPHPKAKRKTLAYGTFCECGAKLR